MVENNELCYSITRVLSMCTQLKVLNFNFLKHRMNHSTV